MQNITTTKELSDEELFHLSKTFKDEIHNNTDIELLGDIIETYVRKLTPAQFVHLFLLNKNSSLSIVNDPEKRSIIPSPSKSILAECLQTDEPQLVNDIKRSTHYDHTIDNPFEYDLKNLLVLPLHDINNTPFALIWAGIPKGNIKQFIQEDIDNVTLLVKQISYVKPSTSESKAEEKHKTQEEGQTKNESNTIKTTDSTTFVKKIKSLFFKKYKHR